MFVAAFHNFLLREMKCIIIKLTEKKVVQQDNKKKAKYKRSKAPLLLSDVEEMAIGKSFSKM